jgi:hypothetical protein
MIYVTTSPVSQIMESQMEDNYKQLILNHVNVRSRNLVTDIIVVCYCYTAPTLIRTWNKVTSAAVLISNSLTNYPNICG